MTDLAQSHQFNEIMEALPKLSKSCVVLLDDNNYPNGGKTKRAKALLQDKGFIHVMDFQQSLFMRYDK